MLHTRLVQYEQHCVLLSVLYDVQSRTSRWGFTASLPCEADRLEEGTSQIASAFASRPPNVPGDNGAVTFAIIPVQHRVKELVWATESFAEVLSTMVAEAGFAVVPASVVAENLKNAKEPHRACGTERCALELATSAQAARCITTEIRKRGAKCSVTASSYDVAKKRRIKKTMARGGCEAHEVAASLQQVAKTLLIGTVKAPPKEEPKAEPKDEPQNDVQDEVQDEPAGDTDPDEPELPPAADDDEELKE